MKANIIHVIRNMQQYYLTTVGIQYTNFYIHDKYMSESDCDRATTIKAPLKKKERVNLVYCVFLIG